MSLSVIAMWARLGPTVATFHTSNDHSRLMRLAKPFIKPGMEELDARIAVSPSADRTVKQHLHLAATHIIPNGVDTAGYVNAQPKREWQGTRVAPVIGILGRMDEARKGLDDFLAMIPEVRSKYPRTRFLVAGRFSDRVAAKAARAGAEIIGELKEDEKEVFMSSVDIYCAPNTGGESFGIVLVEAMAAGAAVVASDLVAFKDVATNVDGIETVAFHRVGDSSDLAAKILGLLRDPSARAALARLGQECAKEFDWDVVAPRVLETYRDAIRMDAEFHPHPS
jgi:phosphatidylinositol alpha-mannosyltransferase